MNQYLVVYGPAVRPQVYATAYTPEDLAIAIGHCERAHPGAHARMVAAHRMALHG